MNVDVVQEEVKIVLVVELVLKLTVPPQIVLVGINAADLDMNSVV